MLGYDDFSEKINKGKKVICLVIGDDLIRLFNLKWYLLVINIIY